MRIRILQVGANKGDYIKKGVEEFLKRLKLFVKIDVIEIEEMSKTKTCDSKKCIKFEGKAILSQLNKYPSAWIIALDEKGKELNSIGFSKLIEKEKDLGRELIFVIGGAFGLDDAVKQRVNFLLSFSKMTFTHQMIRLFLLEQIYRAICIMIGKEYHHE